MELILTNEKGNDIRVLNPIKADFDIGVQNDFEVVIPADEWQNDFQFGCRLYEPNTENGGIIGAIKTDTAENTITLKGYTWRGLLDKKIIEPPNGADYKTVKGDLHTVMASIVQNAFSSVIRSSEIPSGITISYQFERYTDMLTGLSKMLLTKSHKLKIKYVQQEKGAAGFVELSAVPIFDYSEKIELSQDSKLNFVLEKNKNNVNHLIALGKGELKNREVIHLYLQKNGTIGKKQFYKGINEITETYDNANSENLEEDAVNHFLELLKSTSFSMNIESLDIDVDIGDIVGGRDYITGLYIKKPLIGKIVTFENGYKTSEYKLEGEN